MKVEIIKSEIIKPASPTLDHLRTLKLSLLDQIAPSALIPSVFFYPVDGEGHANPIVMSSTERSQCLKRSLSETLTQFFPLAGRIKDDASIDCNDEGVGYFEAHVDCLLEDIVGQLEQAAVLQPLVPVYDESVGSGLGCLLLVQTNFFKCGGMAICVSCSHKIFDAASFGAFMKAWSVTAIESGEALPFPDFSAAALLFPARDVSIALPGMHATSFNCIKKRFLFDASKLPCLKAKAASASVPQPTRVEAVSALIWKCAIKASRENSGGSTRLSVLGQGVNLRNRIVSLPENSMGNLIGHFSAQTKESGVELQSLVGHLRRGMTDFCNDHATKLVGENGFTIICESFKQAEIMVKKDDVDFYTFTSWCRLPMYADFGWGKPTRMGIALPATKNIVILMDTRDGDGIEASVSLSLKERPYLNVILSFLLLLHYIYNQEMIWECNFCVSGCKCQDCWVWHPTG